MLESSRTTTRVEEGDRLPKVKLEVMRALRKLRNQQPAEPLVWNDALYLAAADHCQDAESNPKLKND